jgi:ABC-2 type transport system permease protein
MSAWKKLYWSIRRELWEHRSITLAPLSVAVLVLVVFLVRSFGLPQRIRALEGLDPIKQVSAIAMTYSMAASVILLISFIISAFYCLDALNGERRDRSILFWKSMPVSDFTTVLSKAAIPFVVQPLLAFGIALATQLIMLIASTSILVFNGMNPMQIWGPLPLFTMTVVMLYGLVVHALWYAPIYGLFLLISVWAKRAAFLWAFLPVITLMAIEALVMNTAWTAGALRYRLLGAMNEAFALKSANSIITQFSQLDPWRFLTSGNMWLGLVFGVVCIAFAIRLRREREPI